MLSPADKAYLFAAFLSFLASVLLWFTVNQSYGLYVGLWVPSILILWVGMKLTELKAFGLKGGE